ncbi:MAG: MATE family efflux transporter [Bacteroidetes bacterium]|nr:MATE family efflux transporter [Bacteroidota bacterium]
MIHTEYTYKNIWKVAYPIIIGLIAQNLMVVIDTAFLGRLGAVSLGAAAIGGLFYLCIVMLGTGFSVGVQILIGRRNGERKYRQIGIILMHTFYVMIAIAAFAFILISLLAPSLLLNFLASEAVYSESMAFLSYRKFGLLFGFLVMSFNALYIGTIRTRVVSVSTIIMAVVNIVFDYGLIFGKLGMPEMGIKGAALATNIAEFSAFSFYIGYSLYRGTFKKYRIFKIWAISKPIIKNLLRLSVPVMFQYFISFSAWFIFFLIIEKHGEVSLAASNIARSIYMFLMIPVWGLSSAIHSLVSNTIGEGRISHVMPLVKKVIKISVICSFCIIILPVIFPEVLISFYTEEYNVIQATIPLIYVVSIALLAFSVGMIVFSALSGTGKTLVALKIEILSIFLYLAFAYVFANVLKASTPVVWMVEIIYFILMGAFSGYYLLLGKWKHLKI